MPHQALPDESSYDFVLTVRLHDVSPLQCLSCRPFKTAASLNLDPRATAREGNSFGPRQLADKILLSAKVKFFGELVRSKPKFF
jgi:hypothetical protein